MSQLIMLLSLGALAAILTAANAQTATCHIDNVPVPGLNKTALSAAEFTALHTAIAPRGPQERWMEIPWQTDLAAARQKAAHEKKPLLMWVMDGHPLGCT